MSNAKYHKQLAALLDLPVANALHEAPGKLNDTVMFINGVLENVRNVREDGIILHASPTNPAGKSIMGDCISSLELWLPKTGVYSEANGNRKVFLQRVPYRQWKRSFSATFYDMKWLPSNFGPTNIDPKSRVDFWADTTGNVWYMTYKVAVFKDSETILCLDCRFEQEIRDFIRNNPSSLVPPDFSAKTAERKKRPAPTFETYMEV